jgi:hypothetical protein
MAVTMALFTRDLRVHDNPVLVAAANNGDAVLPMFVVDDAIASTNYLNPNKASFLSAALAELDDELRRRGGRLIVRHGSTVAEVEQMIADLSITEVHVASDVSGYAQRRERRLRDRLSARGCTLQVHSSTVTVSEPGELTPLNGQDHFSVFTPYYRKWNAAGTRRVLPAPTALNVAEAHSEPLPEASQLASGSPSPKLAVGGETTARQLVKKWLAGPVDEYHINHNDLPPTRRRGCRRTCISAVSHPSSWCIAAGRPRRGARRSSARSPGVTSMLTCWRPVPPPPVRTTGTGTTVGETVRRFSTPGVVGVPGIRSSTPGCANWKPRGGCTTAPD